MSADGIVAEPTDLLAEMLAFLPAFQTWTDSADEDDALTRVAKISAKPESMNPGGEVPYRAYAIVSMPQGQTIGRGAFTSGDLLLIFQDIAPTEFRRDPNDDGLVDNSEASLPFRNAVGQILEELMIEQEEGGRLMLRPIRQESPLVRAGKGSEVDYFQVAYRVPFGTPTR